MDRMYCSLAELVDELEQAGVKSWKETQALQKIAAASEWIDRTLGAFIPTSKARRFDTSGGLDCWVDPLLAVTSIVDDGVALLAADYLLHPRKKLWENGPYIRVSIDPDATTLSGWSYARDALVITGRWGLYERSVSLVATTTQEDDATSLVVDDASQISPGCVLKIDDEQELVEATGLATDVGTNTAEALDASQEEIDLVDASLVHAGEVIKVNFEQMRVLDIAGNTILVARGYNGSKRITHLTGQDVFVYRTFGVRRGVNGTTAAAHAAAAVSRYVPPEDVGYLCRQIAALMLKKAGSGYAGKTGNAELGEVFYNNEFPKDVIERIRSNYFVPLL